MKKLIFCSFMILHVYNACAQDSLYVEKFRDYMKFKAGVTYRALNFTLSPREDGLTQFLQPILYRPSVRSSLSLDVAFKGLSVGWSFGLAQNRLFSSKQSESKYFDFQLHSLGKKLSYDFYYQNYQGYFIENIEDRLANNLLEQRDDITLKNISGNVTYIFNGDRFSNAAAFTQSQKQLKSAGSFILAGSLGYLEAEGDSSFIPEDTDVSFDPRSYVSNASFYTLSILPGYAYTLLLGKKGWQISAGVSGLIGLRYSDTFAEDSQEVNYYYFSKAIARAFTGYHGKVWVFGVSALTDIQGLNTKYVQYRTNNINATFFCIYKLKTKWMEGKDSFFQKK